MRQRAPSRDAAFEAYLVEALQVAGLPPLGGFITTYFSWHWIFLINVPIVVLCLLASMRAFPQIRQPADRRFDALSWLMLGGVLVCLIVVLEGVRENRMDRLVWVAALLVFARHAGDRETITLIGHEMSVEQHVGPAVERVRFRAEWVRVEPQGDDGQMIEVRGGGQSVRVGRFLRPDLRPVLAREIRLALRGV